MIERIALAAHAGFHAIEIQFPYDEDPQALKAKLDEYGLPLVLMNFPAGDLMTGGQGLAAVPGREKEFEELLPEVRRFAETLRPRTMNLLSGRPDSKYGFRRCQNAFCNNLRKSYALTHELGINLVTEPANDLDLPGFFLTNSRQVTELIKSMSDIELFIQYDLYHMQLMEPNVEDQLPGVIEYVKHIQFSDVPDRTQPGLGTLDFEQLFVLIDKLEYAGYVGAEYFPTIDTSETLGWLSPYR